MLLPPTFIAGLLPEAFKPEFIKDKNSGQNPGASFPLCSYSIVVDIPEILIVYSMVGFKQISVAAACMLDAQWGIVLCMYTVLLYLYLSDYCST